MLLKRLELSGFKSFAHPTILEFATPITAIVGPNGSGKSNIVEAMRFVLGEQSMKSLRGKRGEDLIFHGSKSLPRLGRASIAVVFDNAKNVFPLDYDEVEIKRAVYRDGTNHYFLNGGKTRLKDILELLAAVHIGASSHHIISQGETDRILSASLSERRAMVEDALGLKIYQYKLTESERKLEKTRENVAQTETLRREISSHLGFLEKQVEKIREGEALRAELAKLYREYLRGEELFLGTERQKLEKEKGNPQEEQKAIEQKIREKEEARKGGEREAKDSARRREIEDTTEKLRREKAELSRSLGRLEGLIEYAGKERTHREKEREERLSFSRKETEEFSRAVDAEVARGEGSVDILFLRHILKTVKEKISAFFEKYAQPQDEAPDGATLARFTKEKEEAERKLERVLADEEKCVRELESARRAADEQVGALRVMERELLALRTRENELRTRAELFRYREERLRQEEARFREELAEAGRLLGTQILGFGEEGDGAPPPRDEQEKKRKKIERMKIKVEEAVGGGADVLKEYEGVKERDSFLAKELLDLSHTAGALENLIKELLMRIDIEFKGGVEKINKEFQEIFQSLFGGGHAALAVVRPQAKKKRRSEIEEIEDAGGAEEDGDFADEEPEEGIDITLTLPTKRVKGLGVLSGGERSLTAIALVFAITMVNPPPFLILDETDAALDESNSRKYGNLLTELKRRTQFLVVTHNRETMTRAGVLYGVTAGADGTSRILSVKMDEAEELAKEDVEGEGNTGQL